MFTFQQQSRGERGTILGTSLLSEAGLTFWMKKNIDKQDVFVKH